MESELLERGLALDAEAAELKAKAAVLETGLSRVAESLASRVAQASMKLSSGLPEKAPLEDGTFPSFMQMNVGDKEGGPTLPVVLSSNSKMYDKVMQYAIDNGKLNGLQRTPPIGVRAGMPPMLIEEALLRDRVSAARVRDALTRSMAPPNVPMSSMSSKVFLDVPADTDQLPREFTRWLSTKPFVLQQPHRCAHKGIEEMGLEIVKRTDGKVVQTLLEHSALQVIMVSHDWGGLLGHSKQDGPGGEWHPPYSVQIFEFAISGAAVLATVSEHEGVAAMSVAIRLPVSKAWVNDRCLVLLDGTGWRYLTEKLAARGDPKVNADFARLYDFVSSHVRAVAVMLEAEVAKTEAVRAPYKTNRPPKEHAPLPALSFHILKLNRRPRPAPPAFDPNHVPGTRKRLHFRQGHWRHYSNHKTWIKWMLVGDPDLGFVDKDYQV